MLHAKRRFMQGISDLTGLPEEEMLKIIESLE
jgi:hypothetical protein